MKNLIQRFNDWRRERRIRYLRHKIEAHYMNGERDLAYQAQFDLGREIAERSAEQVMRMEQRRGLV